MTNLTEQWKKGDLVSGISYYVEDTNGYINALEYIDAGVDSHFSIRESVIKRIIAPVPSYEEWIGVKQQRDLENKLRHYSDNKNWQLRTENAQLRELLKECRTPILVYNQRFGDKESLKRLLQQIDEVLK